MTPFAWARVWGAMRSGPGVNGSSSPSEGCPWGLVSNLLRVALMPTSLPGDQGWGGDHMQVPRRVRLVHRADVLAAAGAFP